MFIFNLIFVDFLLFLVIGTFEINKELLAEIVTSLICKHFTFRTTVLINITFSELFVTTVANVEIFTDLSRVCPISRENREFI